MSKNKLVWTIALFLIAVTSLPIAHAQTLGSSLFFVLINALIVGIVLFILQSFLLPEKAAKEKTVVYTAIIFGSLLFGFLYGRSGFIWQGHLSVFFNWYVLVNTIIISIVLYFVSGLLGLREKLGSKEGSAGFGIILFIVSAFIAVSLGQQFVWSNASVKLLIDYLFGEYGILNPARGLWIFVSSAFLLAFFFNTFLLKNAGLDVKVSYGLAIILGASIARAGYGVKTVVIMGEFVFLLILADALKGTTPAGATGGNKWAWILSFFLVGWASAAMTGGTDYQGILGGILWNAYNVAGGKGIVAGVLTILTLGGLLSGASGVILFAIIAAIVFFAIWSKTGNLKKALLWGVIIFGAGLLIALTGGLAILLVLLLPLLFIGGVGAAVARGERKEGIWQAFKQRNFTRLWNEIKTRFQRQASQIGVALKWDIPEGREPKSFVENRLLLFALLDYSLRLDIFNVKRYNFDFIQKPKISMLWGPDGLVRYYDRKLLRREIRDYRIGEQIGTFATGWARFDRELLERIRRIVELMYMAIRVTRENSPTLEQELTNIAQEMININARLNNLAASTETGYINFKGRYNPYGVWHHIRSIILNLYDMYNVYGVYEHDYLFPKPGAKFRINPYQADTNAVNLPDAQRTVEVNLFGYDVERINLNQPLRKLLNPREQSDFYRSPSASEGIGEITLPTIMNHLTNEWRGMVEDFRKGTYSPNSRTIQDYSTTMSEGIDVHMNDDAVTNRVSGFAFDRRVLVNPGLWKYWGRRHYYGDVNDIVMESPYPRLTVLGIQSYLEALIKLRERDPERVINDFLNSYPLDLEREIRTKEDLVRAIGRFREKQAT